MFYLPKSGGNPRWCYFLTQKWWKSKMVFLPKSEGNPRCFLKQKMKETEGASLTQKVTENQDGFFYPKVKEIQDGFFNQKVEENVLKQYIKPGKMRINFFK